MPYRRGFKKLCEEIAAEVRAEMGLSSTAPMDPVALSAHLAIPVMPFAQLATIGLPPSELRVLRTSSSAVSAFTYYIGTRKLIYYNDAHAPTRNANSVAHELAHVILEHEPATAGVPVYGAADWSLRQETEATWLAGALLLPRAAIYRWLFAGREIADGAAHFGVSVDLFRWRANSTGVTNQVRRRA